MSTEVATKRQSFDLSPQTFEQALTFSEYLAASEMVPKAYRGKPGDCLIAMQWGAEVGLKPLQALQSIATINGKPGLYGDAGKALLLANGCLIEEDDSEKVRSNSKARCKITRPGHHPTERTYSIEDAKTANLWGKEGPWRTAPYRQMAWRAFWFAARDAASDILRGLDGVENLVDYQPAAATKDMGPAEVVQSSLPPYEQPKFDHNLKNTWAKRVADGGNPDDLIVMLQTRNSLTAEQIKAIKALAAPATSEAQWTGSEVEKRLKEASDLDALYIAGDLIHHVQNPDDQTSLNQLFEERQAQLKG